MIRSRTVSLGGAILNLTLVVGLLGFMFGCSKKPTADEWALDQLKQTGADLSKPHKLEFKLHFPTPEASGKAVEALKAAGYEVAVTSDRRSGGVVCNATRTMVPEVNALQKAHTDLSSLATSLGGGYDGWGMAAEK
jgi:rhodanese-related sulfurtransferase